MEVNAKNEINLANQKFSETEVNWGENQDYLGKFLVQ